MAILIWRSPWRLRFATALLVGAFVITPFIPDRVWERLESIRAQTEEETADTSVQGRFQAWRTGWNMAMDRPLTGGGFRAYWNDEVWNKYHEGYYFVARDAHSLYFEVLGEHGFLGFGLYMLFLVNSVFNLWRIRRRWRKHPEHGYLSHYAEMLLFALAPYLVAGAFIGVAYFDLYFHLMATGIALQALSAQAARARVTKPSPVPATTLPAVRQRGIMRTGNA
jgi:probable O-glycosylation ligase (exosortase A-associated)